MNMLQNHLLVVNSAMREPVPSVSVFGGIVICIVALGFAAALGLFIAGWL